MSTVLPGTCGVQNFSSTFLRLSSARDFITVKLSLIAVSTGSSFSFTPDVFLFFGGLSDLSFRFCSTRCFLFDQRD